MRLGNSIFYPFNRVIYSTGISFNAVMNIITINLTLTLRCGNTVTITTSTCIAVLENWLNVWREFTFWQNVQSLSTSWRLPLGVTSMAML